MKNYLTTITILSILLISCIAQSEVLVVDPSGGGDFLSFEEAIAGVVAGDTIEFVDGAHNVDSTVDITTPGIILKSASGNAQSCSISGAGMMLVVDHENTGEFSIEVHDLGFALASGFVNCMVLVHGCNLSIGMEEGMYFDTLYPVIIENTYFENGRLTVDGSGITLRSCQFVDSGFFGMNYLSGSLVMENCSFTGSSVVQIYRAESVVLDRCTFTENDNSPLLEVAAFNEISITSCLFSDNQLEGGPALLVAARNPETNISIEDCSFRNNTSTGYSTAGLRVGGIPLGQANVFCENVDFVDNVCPNGAPDAFVWGPSGSLTLNCCEIDEANIGGEGEVTISYDGCTVAAEHSSWGGLKALFR